MKPNEHIKLPDDELIAHIKGQLMAHEEDYAPGAWENFNSNQPAKKRGVFFWFASLSSAAALVLIGFALFFVNNKKEGPESSVMAETKPSNEVIKLPEVIKGKVPKSDELIKGTKPVESRTSIPELSNSSIAGVAKPAPSVGIGASEVSISNSRNRISPSNNKTTVTEAVVALNNSEIASRNSNTGNTSTTIPIKEQQAIVKQAQEQVQSPVKEVLGQVKTQSLEEFLAQESKNGNARGRRNQVKVAALPEDKWEMGVMVAPSVGSSKKLNMGYGLSMGYALNKRISINSGISYNEMGASRSAAPASNGAQSLPSTMGMGLAGNSKELKEVDANIRGIDIPLEIRYRLTKSLYANVGISAFAVLNQKQKSTFLESQVQNSPNDGAASVAFKTTVLSTTVTEEKKNSELKTDPYLGFYNFSLGYKQQISRGKSVSLEPFVKLPIKEFTQENLYLIGTGLRLKFDF